MATECSDFGATAIANTLLCRVPEGNPFPGLITYRDGRVAALDSAGPSSDTALSFFGPNGSGRISLDNLSPEAVRLIRDMQGSEIDSCARQRRLSYSPLPTFFRGTPLTWNTGHLRELFRLFGNTGTNSGNAFMCSDAANSGNVFFNSDPTNRPRLEAAFNSLNASCGTLDSDHCAAMLESLRIATGRPPTQSTWDQIKGIAGYLLGGIFVFVVGGVGAHILGKWWDNRGGPKPPSEGGGGGGDNFERGFLAGMRAAQQNAAAPADAPVPAATNPSVTRVGLDPELAAGLGVLDESNALVPGGARSGGYVTIDQVSVEGSGSLAPGTVGALGGPGATIRLPNVSPVRITPLVPVRVR